MIEGVAGEWSPFDQEHGFGIGWCLDPHDLCAAKLCAGRQKDMNFVAALLAAQLVQPEVLFERLATVPATHEVARERALAWLSSRGARRD